MGLKDVAALAEVVVDAARLGMDLGQADVLDRYQRWRRFDTMAMGLATNSLNLLFSNQSTLLRTVRDIGLGLVDRAPPLKTLFIRQAAGLAGEVPNLLKGEALSVRREATMFGGRTIRQLLVAVCLVFLQVPQAKAIMSAPEPFDPPVPEKWRAP